MATDATAGVGTPAEPTEPASPTQAVTTAVGTQAEPTSTPSKPSPAPKSDEPMSLDEAKKLRAEAKSLRDRIQAYEDAKLTEAERAEKKRADEQAKTAETLRTYQERTVRAELKAATPQGINPALLAKVIDFASIVYDDASGEPTNINEVVAKAIVDYGLTAQAGQPAAPNSGAVGAPARSATGATMVTPQQYADYGFHTTWATQHNGQSLTEARRLGLVRITG